MRLKVLTVIDIKGWAIDGLNQQIVDHNQHIDFEVFPCHPKHVEKHTEELAEVLKRFKPQVIHFQYWNTGKQLMELCPALKEFPCVLTHHNVKNLLSGDWSCINRIVTATKESGKVLAEEYGNNNVSVVPYGIDLNRFKFNKEYPPKNKMIGYVGRVEKWKRLHQIQAAAAKIKENVLCMGAKGKPAYWDSFPKDNLIFDLECSDKKLVENYKKMSVFVNNSSQGRESGTLPLLEAMAMGVPVVTTRTGMAQDMIRNGHNGLLIDDEGSNIADCVKEILDNPKLADKLRKAAWGIIKNFTAEKFARQYARIYREVIFEDENSVSVVIPTYNRAKNLEKLLKLYERQAYKNFEIVVCDDNSSDDTKKVVEKARKELDLTIKYVNTELDGYNIAAARNMGIEEAEGKWILFCDDRLVPVENAISEFIGFASNRDGKYWFYGDKGGSKKSFVENFSFVKKKHIANIGGFNERIRQYGGMTQDVRTRWEATDGKFKFYGPAQAKELISSKASNKRDEIVKSKYQIYKNLIEPNEKTVHGSVGSFPKDI